MLLTVVGHQFTYIHHEWWNIITGIFSFAAFCSNNIIFLADVQSIVHAFTEKSHIAIAKSHLTHFNIPIHVTIDGELLSI